MKRQTAIRSVKRATGKRSRGAANVVARNEMMTRSAALAPADTRSRDEEQALSGPRYAAIVAAGDEAGQPVGPTLQAAGGVGGARLREEEDLLAPRGCEVDAKRESPIEEMLRQHEKLRAMVLGQARHFREADRAIRDLDGIVARFETLDALRIRMNGNLQDLVPKLPIGLQDALEKVARLAELERSWASMDASVQIAKRISNLAGLHVPHIPMADVFGPVGAARASAVALRATADASDVLANQIGATSAAVRALSIGKDFAQRFRRPKRRG